MVGRERRRDWVGPTLEGRTGTLDDVVGDGDGPCEEGYQKCPTRGRVVGPESSFQWRSLFRRDGVFGLRRGGWEVRDRYHSDQ